MTVFQDRHSSYLYVAESELEAIDMYLMTIPRSRAYMAVLEDRFNKSDIDWLTTNHLVFHEALDGVVHYSRPAEDFRYHIVDNILMRDCNHNDIDLLCLRNPWMITVTCDYWGGYLVYPEYLSGFKKAVKKNEKYPDQMIDVHFETEADYLQVMLMK